MKRKKNHWNKFLKSTYHSQLHLFTINYKMRNAQLSGSHILCGAKHCKFPKLCTEMRETEWLGSDVGQQAPPEGAHCGTSGASHTFIKCHSKYLAGREKRHKVSYLTTQSPKWRLLLPRS